MHVLYDQDAYVRKTGGKPAGKKKEATLFEDSEVQEQWP